MPFLPSNQQCQSTEGNGLYKWLYHVIAQLELTKHGAASQKAQHMLSASRYMATPDKSNLVPTTLYIDYNHELTGRDTAELLELVQGRDV